MVRCGACGRPPQSEIDAGREALKPGEPVDQGCFQEILDENDRLIALVDDKGARIVTDKEAADQALASAVIKHSARELVDFNAKTLSWLQRNAQGLHAVTGLPLTHKTLTDLDGVPILDVQGKRQLVPLTAGELATLKAGYQATLNDRLRAADKDAETPGEKFIREAKAR
jgi:hypothetical protein